MQEYLPKELSELIKPGTDASKTIKFAFLDFPRGRQTSGFNPVCGVNKSSDSDTNSTQLLLPNSQEATNKACGWPDTAHGLIKITYYDGKSIIMWRQGVMIGPNLVLTTASNLYKSGSHTSIKFHPAITTHDSIQPSSSEVGVFKAYSSEIKTANYALLILDDPIGYKTGYFGLDLVNIIPLNHIQGSASELSYGYLASSLQHQEVTTTILQRNETQLQNKKFELKFKTSKIMEVDREQGMIQLDGPIDLDSGQDGSGIFLVKKGSYYYVIGMQSLENINDEYQLEDTFSNISLFTDSDINLFEN